MKTNTTQFLIAFLAITLLVLPIATVAVNTSVTSPQPRDIDGDMVATWLMDPDYRFGDSPARIIKDPLHEGTSSVWIKNPANSSEFLMEQQEHAPLLVYYSGGILKYNYNGKPVEALYLMNKDWPMSGYDWFCMAAAPMDYGRYLSVMGRDINDMDYFEDSMNYSAAPFTTVIINEKVRPPCDYGPPSDYAQWRLWMYNMNAWAFFGNAQHDGTSLRNLYGMWLTEYLWEGYSLTVSFQWAKQKAILHYWKAYTEWAVRSEPFLVTKSGWDDAGDYSEQTGYYSRAMRPRHDTMWDSPFYYARRAHDPAWAGQDGLYEHPGSMFDEQTETFFFRKFELDNQGGAGSQFYTNGAYLMLTGQVADTYENEVSGWSEIGQGSTPSAGTLSVKVKYWNDQYYTTVLSIEEVITNRIVNQNLTKPGYWYHNYAFGGADNLYMFISAETMELLDDGVDRKLRIEVEFTATEGYRQSTFDPTADHMATLYNLQTIELLEIGSFHELS